MLIVNDFVAAHQELVIREVIRQGEGDGLASSCRRRDKRVERGHADGIELRRRNLVVRVGRAIVEGVV